MYSDKKNKRSFGELATYFLFVVQRCKPDLYFFCDEGMQIQE